jgi:mono/diheme cytochrome c family protein
LILLAGCGAGQSVRSTAGRGLFSQACSSCHSLTGVDDPRRQGGDLLALNATRAQLTQLVGEMPVRRPLDAEQLRSVVSYVLAVGRRPR